MAQIHLSPFGGRQRAKHGGRQMAKTPADLIPWRQGRFYYSTFYFSLEVLFFAKELIFSEILLLEFFGKYSFQVVRKDRNLSLRKFPI